MSGRLIVDVLRTVLVSLLVGWIVAAIFGILVAKAQYDAIAPSFSGDQLVSEYNARIDHILKQGAVLILPQIGVVAGLLAWCTSKAATPHQSGLIASVIMSIIYGIVMSVLHIPLLLSVIAIVIIIGAGTSEIWLGKEPNR